MKMTGPLLHRGLAASACASPGERGRPPHVAFFAALLVLAKNSDVGQGAPMISNITMAESGPQLTITADLGMTNQIQTATDLGQVSWTVLTNLLVAQSPYSFVDNLAAGDLQRFYRIVQFAPATNSGPAGMVLIPAGEFQMGDTFNEGATWELPVHNVLVSAFYMDQFEVTKALWDQVKGWSATNGYSYDYDG